MDPDSLSAEFAFPPPPPLMRPPVPPPVVLPVIPPRAGKAEAASLWRWNDRLAVVVVGLMLFLLGIVTGRVFGPDAASDGNRDEPIAAVIATEAAAIAEEVNPPQLIVETASAEPIAPPAATPAAVAAVTPAASEPAPAASSPQPETTETAVITSIVATAKPDSSPPPAAVPQTSPVSLEGKVLSIKPPAATQVCELAEKHKDRKLSTVLTWAESVHEAGQQAEKAEKLVFLIHVSGNFEMPGFT